MDRDDKIDNLTNHLLVAHEDHRESHADNDRLLGDLERLITAIRDGKKESYEIRLILSDFTAEARLLVNDRISEMSVERLADVLTRQKVDQVRALLFAREQGVAESPLAREPTGSHVVEHAAPRTEQPAEDSGRTTIVVAGIRTLRTWGPRWSLALAFLAACTFLVWRYLELEQKAAQLERVGESIQKHRDFERAVERKQQEKQP